MAPATYPELFARAEALVEEGRRATGVRLDDRHHALTVIAERHALLFAIERHLWAVLAPGRSTQTRFTNAPDQAEAAAQHLAAAITRVIGPERPHPSVFARPITPWGRAAHLLRTASDLLALHHDAKGSARSPGAQLLENTSSRDAALARLADLTVTVAAGQDTTALRAGQAGVPWRHLRAAMPATDELARAAKELQHAIGGAAHVALAEVAPIPLTVRDTDVIVEITDRFARTRQHAWQQVQSPDRSLATLRDLATLAVAVHAHTAAFHAGPNGPVVELLTRGRRWQHLNRTLAGFRSLTPGDPVVHDDLVHLARLLTTIAPLHGPGRATEPDTDTRRAGATLSGAVQLMTEFADHGARAFARISTYHSIYMPARHLSREEVTDDPHLAAAHLHGDWIPALPGRLRAVATLYQTLRTHPLPTPAAPPGHTRPLALDEEADHIRRAAVP